MLRFVLIALNKNYSQTISFSSYIDFKVCLIKMLISCFYSVKSMTFCCYATKMTTHNADLVNKMFFVVEVPIEEF